jgi:hypothetical protein
VDRERDERRLRASDADRERVAEMLRAAAADGRLTLPEMEERLDTLYAAKTYAELEPVVDDLPGTLDVLRPTNAPLPRAADASSPARVGGSPTSREAKAVFGGVARRGQWVVPRWYRVKAVFGGVDLDLRQAQLEEREVTIDAKAVFGGVNVVVPEDITVLIDGSGVFGGFGGDAEDVQPPAGGPVLRVVGKAVFGGVAVQRKPRS